MPTSRFLTVSPAMPLPRFRPNFQYLHLRPLHPNTDQNQVDESDLASVSADDLQILQDARVMAEDAETGTGGFDDKIAAASGDTTTLQNGKIKNKVLKLKLEVLALQIEAAQGNGDQTKIDEEQTKLNNNISLDTAAAGQVSVGVTDTFSG